MAPANIVMFVAAPLIMWRVYKRVRRLTVRQPSRLWRHWIGALAFPLILGGFAIALAAKPLALAAIAGGMALGIVLGLVALRRTGFEHSGGAYFYTPYAPIGMFIALLLIARVLYRAYEFYILGPAQLPDFGNNILTLVILGTVGGYYHAYSTGLLRWRNNSNKK